MSTRVFEPSQHAINMPATVKVRVGTALLCHGRENFATTDWIKVPKIWWDYTTSEVLTMEYCPGVKINRIAELDRLGLDRQRLARLSVESYLQQLVRSRQRGGAIAAVCHCLAFMYTAREHALEHNVLACG